MIPGLQSAKGRKPNWEELRKEARQLENQIDAKLVQLSKLGTSLNCSPSLTSGFGVTDKTPLMAADDEDDDGGKDAASHRRIKALCDDISLALGRLATVNEGLTDWAAQSGGGSGTTPSAAIHHTLQRHKDILQDYQQEFNKTKSNVMAAIERHDLLDSVHKDINNYHRKSMSATPGGGGQGNSAAGNRRMELLLKESEHARNSERLIDEHISIAVESREALVNQRLAFKAIQTKLNDISNKFPMINNLVQKINLRKRRDTIILGAVVGLCVTFLLWYMFG